MLRPEAEMMFIKPESPQKTCLCEPPKGDYQLLIHTLGCLFALVWCTNCLQPSTCGITSKSHRVGTRKPAPSTESHDPDPCRVGSSDFHGPCSMDGGGSPAGGEKNATLIQKNRVSIRPSRSIPHSGRLSGPARPKLDISS